MKKGGLLLLLLFAISCTTSKFLNRSTDINTCAEGLYKVVQFNSSLQNNEFDKSFLMSLIDTLNFNAKINFKDSIKAENIYQEFNKYNSRKFRNGFDYSELNYECRLKGDTLCVTLNSESFMIDSTSFKYLYDYKLLKRNEVYKIISFSEELKSENHEGN